MSRTRSPKKGRSALLLAGLLLASAAGFSALKIATDRVVRSKLPGSSIIYVPSGKFLKYATFGYTALAADAIYLWAIQYYSTYEIPDRFERLDHIFSITAALVGGIIWNAFGFQYVFLMGAGLAVINFFTALQVRLPQKAVIG